MNVVFYLLCLIIIVGISLIVSDRYGIELHDKIVDSIEKYMNDKENDQ